jgi:hypothetical protein
MVRRRVATEPTKKVFGDDFAQEDVENLSLLGGENEMFNDYSQGIQESPEDMVSQYQFKDVPRRMIEQPMQDEPDSDVYDSLGGLSDMYGQAPGETFADEELGQAPLGGAQAEELESPAAMELEDPMDFGVEEQADERMMLPNVVSTLQSAFNENPEVLELMPDRYKQMMADPDSPLAQHQMQEVQELAEPIPGGIEAGIKDAKTMLAIKKADGMLESEDYPQEAWETGLMTEQMRKKRFEDLTEQERDLVQRAENNQLTREEIIGIGLATIIPAVLGLMYGKEAALSAIAGGLQGAVDFQSKKGKKADEAPKRS